MIKTKTQIILTIILLTVLGLRPSPTFAQLNREISDIFKGMLDELPNDLRAKFQDALDHKQSTIEFTPDEFRRFRNHPINPFEGELKDINPDDLDGNIELKFELPSVRNRPIQEFERQSRSLRRSMRPATASVAPSVVKIMSDGQQVALGIIVGENGVILTKASEVADREKLQCRIGHNQKFDATVTKTNTENDLALLKIDGANLPVIRWSNRQAIPGSFVLSPNQLNQVISIGTYSAVQRSVVGKNQAFLGVQPRTGAEGVVIDEVTINSAAAVAGLLEGDVITRLDETKVTDVTHLVNEIRKRAPGDRVRIEFVRNGRTEITNAKLAGHDISGERAARFKMMSRLGAIPSDRNSDFPAVFQHDSPLFPEQCGGPVCDLAGNVLGINIARNSRAATYAIPSSQVEAVLADMVRADVAATQGSDSR